MRITSILLRWLATLVFALSSCRSSIPNLKPPRAPEDYSLPSASDKRYSTVDIYPKEVLQDNYLQQKINAQNNPGKGPSMGMGPPGGGGQYGR